MESLNKLNKVIESININITDDNTSNLRNQLSELVPLYKTTIPFTVIGKHGASSVLIRSASKGTGVIAGGGIRAVLEAAGIKDVLTKSMRSNNPSAMVFATMDALAQLRTRETILALRKA